VPADIVRRYGLVEAPDDEWIREEAAE
jgi:hypothetical protein